MDTQQSLMLKKYVDLVFRWKYLLLLLFVVGLVGGMVSYIITPKTYMATSLLSYQQPQISPNKTPRDVTARIRDVVSTLTQIVTSRTNLEEIIKSFDLYRDAREEYPMEDVINMMRMDISIEPSRRGDTFEISFSGEDQGKVAKVANALAAKFIEENLKYREERASETSEYTSNRLEMAKRTMDVKEATMRDYKLKYYNEMPEQRGVNVERLTSLQEQYQGTQESMLALERTRVLIQDQVAARKEMLEGEKIALIGENGNISRKGLDSRAQYLERLRLTLESLEVKYKPNHPEIKRVKKMISKFEQETRDSGEESSSGSDQIRDEVLMKLQAQLSNVDFSMETIAREKEQLSEKIKQYEEWIAAAPVREAEWSGLTREYAQLKHHYDQLVALNLEAKSMLNLERRQKGNQFKIVDPARFPEKPVKPDFLKTMLVALGAVLVMGCGFILITDFLDGSFRESEELEQYFGVPLITTISSIQTNAEKRRGTITSIMKIAGVSVCFVLVIALYWYMFAKGIVVV
ncbi:GumC family protein [Desulfosediminicola sp.]|uniref:GumC family protein n=1 Tax=Desulfosediminicola sp. TaxID=2886825 RepID=UPI003AF2D0C7